MCPVDSRIAEGLEESLPQLQTLVLVNNNIEELVSYTEIYLRCLYVSYDSFVYIQGDLDPLASLHNLTYLRYACLFGNCLSKYQVVSFL